MKPDIYYQRNINAMAIDIVQEYYDECLFEPGKKWPIDEFELRTYGRWVATEIIRALKADPMTPPLMIIEEIVDKMEKFCYVTEDTEQSLMFAIAKDTAEDIARLFL